MRNKYAGICYRCGKWCGAGDGHFERSAGSSWRVQHAECALAHRNPKYVNAKEFKYVRR